MITFLLFSTSMNYLPPSLFLCVLVNQDSKVHKQRLLPFPMLGATMERQRESEGKRVVSQGDFCSDGQ